MAESELRTELIWHTIIQNKIFKSNKSDVYKHHIQNERPPSLNEIGWKKKPEGIISKNGYPYVVIEAKNSERGVEEARNDLIQYGNELLNDFNVMVPFFFACSLEKAELYFNHPERGFIQAKINGIPIRHFPDIRVLEELEVMGGEANYGSHTAELSPDELSDFCNKVNNILHNNSVQEGQRANVFTALLIAILNEDFRNTFLDKGSLLKKQRHYDKTYASEEGKRTAISEEIKDMVNRKIEEIATAKNISISEDIRIRDDNGYAVYCIIEMILNRADSNVFINSLIESTYLLGDIYETFYTYAGQNSMGQYFTPRHVVEFMVKLVEEIRGTRIKDDDVIYDPACGVGGFLVSAFARGVENAISEGLDPELCKENLGGNGLFGVEKSASVASIARINLLLRGDGKSGIIHGDSLENYGFSDINDPLGTKYADAMGKKLRGRRDGVPVSPTIVLMNPPFPADKKIDPKASQFIDQAVKLAAPGSIIAALIPTSIILADEYETFRRKILEACKLKAVVTLPQGLFAPKASINTSIIVLTKKGDKSSAHKPNDQVIFSQCLCDGFELDKASNTRKKSAKQTDDLKSFLASWYPNYQSDANKHHTVPKKFKMAYLSKEEIEKGSEWTPEARLDAGEIDIKYIQKLSRIIASQRSAYELIYKANLGEEQEFHIPALEVTNERLDRLHDELNSHFGKKDKILTIGDVFYKVDAGFNGSVKKDADSDPQDDRDTALISASEFNNSICGYVSFNNYKEKTVNRKKEIVLNNEFATGNFISVAKNGKPCVARFHKFSPDRKAVATSDAMIIKLNKVAGAEVCSLSEEDYAIISALIQNKIWRFSYGRKLTWDRFEKIELFS